MFLSTICKIEEELYEKNAKKYLKLKLSTNDVLRVIEIHKKMYDVLTLPHVEIPLEGDILKVKVPYRYNRVMCKFHGSKVVQEMKKGDVVEVKIQCMGPWFYKPKYCGIAWKLELISLNEQATNPQDVVQI